MAETSEPIQLHVNFVGGDEVPVLYASNVFVRHLEDMFLISFAQVQEHYRLQLTEEELEELRKRGLNAKVIARIAVSPSKMREFVDVLKRNLEIWESRVRDAEDEHGHSQNH